MLRNARSGWHMAIWIVPILALIISTIMFLPLLKRVADARGPAPIPNQCWIDDYGKSLSRVHNWISESAGSTVDDIILFRWDQTCDYYAGKSIGITEGNYPTSAWKGRFDPC